MQADLHCLIRRAFLPAHDAVQCRYLPGHRQQCKTGHDALHLVSGILRHQGGPVAAKSLSCQCGAGVHVAGEEGQPDTKGDAVKAGHPVAEGIGKLLAAGKALQLLKRAMLPGIAGDLYHAHLHPGVEAPLPGAFGVFRQRQLPGGEQQQRPVPAVAYFAVGAGAPLALAVRQHIGNHSGLTRVHFAQFIERQQGIVVSAGNSLQRIPGGPPGVPVIGAATDGGGHLHYRGFAVGGLTGR